MNDMSDGTDTNAATKTGLRFPALRRWGLDRKQTALLIGILVLTLLAFVRSLSNGFVYDDYPALVRNHHLRQWSFIWESIHRDVWWYYGIAQPPQSSYYRPLQNICLALGFHLVGLYAPGWHLLKILLHLCVVLVAFRLAQLLTRNITLALLVALLFAIWPINGAAVVSIQALGEPLAALFAMASLCAFIQRSKTGFAGMILPVILFAASAFSHETSVLFPLVIAAYVFLFETADAGAPGRESASLAARVVRTAARSAPFVIVAMFYMAARAMVLGPSGILGLSPRNANIGNSPVPVSLFQPHPNFTSLQILMTIPTVIVHYVELLIFPWIAGPAHDITGVMAPSFVRLCVPVAILVVLAALGYLVFRNSPRAKLYLFCAVWALVGLAPAFSFNHIVSFVQDRYLYLSSFAFFLWLGTLVIDFVGESAVRGRAVAAAFIVVTVVNLGKLWRLEPIWHDNLTLFSHCVEAFPESSYYHRLLASTLVKNGDFAAAVPHLRFIYKPVDEAAKAKEPDK